MLAPRVVVVWYDHHVSAAERFAVLLAPAAAGPTLVARRVEADLGRSISVLLALEDIDPAAEGDRFGNLGQPVHDELIVEAPQVPEPAAFAVGLTRPNIFWVGAGSLEQPREGRVRVSVWRGSFPERRVSVAARVESFSFSPLAGLVAILATVEPLLAQPVESVVTTSAGPPLDQREHASAFAGLVV